MEGKRQWKQERRHGRRKEVIEERGNKTNKMLKRRKM